jgi:hypothetical protein
MRRLLNATLSCVVLGAGCDSSPVVGSRVGRATVLRVGEVAEFADERLRVGFAAVQEDSRCPPADTGVVCVWEGVAAVLVWAEKRPQARSTFILATTNAGGYSTRAGYGEYEIELLDLAPPHGGSITQSEYRLTLAVKAK